LYTVTWDRPVNGALLVHLDAATGQTTEYRYPAINPFDAEMAEMVRRFAAGEPGWPTAADGYVVDETMAGITASAAQNRVVSMVWQDRAG
jgi:predicted dehydrogenase